MLSPGRATPAWPIVAAWSSIIVSMTMILKPATTSPSTAKAADGRPGAWPAAVMLSRFGGVRPESTKVSSPRRGTRCQPSRWWSGGSGQPRSAKPDPVGEPHIRDLGNGRVAACQSRSGKGNWERVSPKGTMARIRAGSSHMGVVRLSRRFGPLPCPERPYTKPLRFRSCRVQHFWGVSEAAWGVHQPVASCTEHQRHLKRDWRGHSVAAVV